MKYVVVIVVVVIGLWLLLRKTPSAPRAPGPSKAKPKAVPAPMVACTHCELQLPQTEALFDAEGRPFCSEAHRLAGPR